MSRIRNMLRSSDKNVEVSTKENSINDSISSLEESVIDGVENVDISEAAMKYLESLFSKHEQLLKERFEASEKKLMDKICSLETSMEAKDKEVSELKSRVIKI